MHNTLVKHSKNQRVGHWTCYIVTYGYPRSNGFIERHVSISNHWLEKQGSKRNIFSYPFWRFEQHHWMLTCFPLQNLCLVVQSTSWFPISVDRVQLYSMSGYTTTKQGMKTYHDKSSRKPDLSPMFVGQKARILDKVNKTWCPATITKKCDQPRSYIVQTPNGTTLRTNRSHLREMYVPPVNLILVMTLPQLNPITNYTTHKPCVWTTTPATSDTTEHSNITQQQRVHSPCARQTAEPPQEIPPSDTTQ